jgi:hypothetical protein
MTWRKGILTNIYGFTKNEIPLIFRIERQEVKSWWVFLELAFLRSHMVTYTHTYNLYETGVQICTKRQSKILSTTERKKLRIIEYAEQGNITTAICFFHSIISVTSAKSMRKRLLEGAPVRCHVYSVATGVCRKISSNCSQKCSTTSWQSRFP